MAQPLVVVLPSLNYAEDNEEMTPLRPVVDVEEVDVEAVSEEATDNAEVVSMEDGVNAVAISVAVRASVAATLVRAKIG